MPAEIKLVGITKNHLKWYLESRRRDARIVPTQPCMLDALLISSAFGAQKDRRRSICIIIYTSYIIPSAAYHIKKLQFYDNFTRYYCSKLK